ncbi:MAG: hypothetical protein M1457_05690 [bacterium]|nr:hypothetical protein [bacterium]
MKLHALAALAVLLAGPLALAAPVATINIQGVSPRDVAAQPNDIYDEASAGLNAVGAGEKMYLQALPLPNTGVTVSRYEWSVVQRPDGSTADVNPAVGEVVTLRPDAEGIYAIRLLPYDGNNLPTDSVTQVVYCSHYAGVGTLDTHGGPAPIAPQCGSSYCHGDSNGTMRLRVLRPWSQSRHANKLQFHMNGLYEAYYAVSCLECHTVGYNTDPQAVNGGFDDVANDLGFDLAQIPQLVADAVDNHHQNFPLLPGPLQNKASVQCESCHGAGSQHPQNLLAADHGIAGVNLDTKQCARCHDSASGFQQGFYQWNISSHPLTASLAEGSVKTNTSCIKCHTGEGFVSVTINGLPAQTAPDPHPITCSSCHDPHFSDYAHQLRVAGDFYMDSGDVMTNAGLGGLCARCHNSRVANVFTTVNNSSRGAHHGPQADMFAGANGYNFNLPFASGSAHPFVVADTCVACHMAAPPISGAGVIDQPKVGGHTYSMRDDMGTADTSDDLLNVANACGGCHGGLANYDRQARGDYDGDGAIEGIQTEMQGLFDLLKPGLMAFAGTTEDSVTHRININSAGFKNLTEGQKGALYNYNFVIEDGSYGIHNTSYAVQLLQRSYQGVYGRLITDDYPNIALRAPVVVVNSAQSWALYE